MQYSLKRVLSQNLSLAYSIQMGVLIHPVGKDKSREESSTLHIVLKKSVHLKPRCTKLVQATVTTESSTLPNLNCYGVVTPNE